MPATKPIEFNYDVPLTGEIFRLLQSRPHTPEQLASNVSTLLFISAQCALKMRQFSLELSPEQFLGIATTAWAQAEEALVPPPPSNAPGGAA